MAVLTADTVRQVLREHILGNYLFTDDAAALGDDESFQDTRLIDSMGMMQLTQFIETTFRFSITEADLVPDKLDSVNRLVALVLERSSAAPEPLTLVELIRSGAVLTRAALQTRDEHMTYGELLDAIERCTRGLAGAGLHAGDRVALLTRHTPVSVALYYAVLAAGLVVVPLDARATARELGARLVHSGARAVLVDAMVHVGPGIRAELPTEIPLLDAAMLAQHADKVPPRPSPAATPDTLAAIVYTSGTTDEPKGVMLSHGNLVANTLAITEFLGLRDTDRVFSPLPLCYAYGASVIHTHLAAGATVILGDMVYPQGTVEQLAATNATGFAGVAWMYSALVSRTTFGQDPTPLPHLRYLLQAGSHMPTQDVARVSSRLPHASLFLMYGQTEATARITYLAPSDLARHQGSVGRPIRDVRLEVRRPDGTPAAPHEPGDVYVAGPNVMLGYWQAPDATRAVIVEDERGRWLRTGDIGRLDEEGFLYLEGRCSDVVKIWGHRVSLNEIEEVARLLPGVAEAAALGVPHTLSGQAVCLVVVRESGAAVTTDLIMAHCRSQLSSFKVPYQVLFADGLPHTATGKIQRRHLLDAARVAS